MSKKIEIEIPEGKVAEWQEINGVTTLVLVDEKDNRPVTERIKTFEDAVKATGMTLPFDDNQLSYLPKDVIAYMKLRVIAAALNGLTEDTLDEFPKFTTDEYRWYPMLNLYTKDGIENTIEEIRASGFMFSSDTRYNSYCGIATDDLYAYDIKSTANFSARLAVKSEALAKYFGQQFIDIWSDYLIGKS